MAFLSVASGSVNGMTCSVCTLLVALFFCPRLTLACRPNTTGVRECRSTCLMPHHAIANFPSFVRMLYIHVE